MNQSSIPVAVVAALALGTGIYVYAPSFSSTNAGGQKIVRASHGHGHGAGAKAHAHGDAGVIEMTDAKANAAGIEILTASPATLRESIVLNGVLQPNQETLVQVTPRFPGVVREIRKRIGETVEKGELLAKVESNQSLTIYEMRAPMSGTIIERQISLGEYASEQKPSFIVADISTVWVDLVVYRRDLARVRVGDAVRIDAGDGGAMLDAQIAYVSPVGNSDTQSALVRAVVPNHDGRLRTGLFVTARLLLSAKPVSVAVSGAAIQTIENRSVIFVRSGDRFEARDVEIGARDPEHVEIVFGLMEGDRYAARNSFVVKAELAKSEASHDH